MSDSQSKIYSNGTVVQPGYIPDQQVQVPSTAADVPTSAMRAAADPFKDSRDWLMLDEEYGGVPLDDDYLQLALEVATADLLKMEKNLMTDSEDSDSDDSSRNVFKVSTVGYYKHPKDDKNNGTVAAAPPVDNERLDNLLDKINYSLAKMRGGS